MSGEKWKEGGEREREKVEWDVIQSQYIGKMYTIPWRDSHPTYMSVKLNSEPPLPQATTAVRKHPMQRPVGEKCLK